MSFTPRHISVSSKHVLLTFDDGNRVTFTITPAVKDTASPAVSGGAITQHPLRVHSNSRRQELIEVTLIKWITSYYSWALPQIWKWNDLLSRKSCTVNKMTVIYILIFASKSLILELIYIDCLRWKLSKDGLTWRKLNQINQIFCWSTGFGVLVY